ncbi:MAG: type II CAAX endopeptidase family protein [Brevinematales bacterium]
MNKKIWIILILLEVFYIIISTYIALNIKDVLSGEIWRNIARIIFIPPYLYFYLKYFKKDKATEISGLKFYPLLIISIVFILLYPLTVKDEPFGDFLLKMVFAVTSIIVGIREELFYRGMLQNSLSEKMNRFYSVFITSIFFTIFHFIYIIRFNPIVLIEIFLVSVVIGFIYYHLRSLILVIAIHTIYDVVFSYVPIFGFLKQVYAINFVVAGVLTILIWSNLQTKVK